MRIKYQDSLNAILTNLLVVISLSASLVHSIQSQPANQLNMEGMYAYGGTAGTVVVIRQNGNQIVMELADYFPEMNKVRARPNYTFSATVNQESASGLRRPAPSSRGIEVPFKLTVSDGGETIYYSRRDSRCVSGKCRLLPGWIGPVALKRVTKSAPSYLDEGEQPTRTFFERQSDAKRQISENLRKKTSDRVSIAKQILESFKPFSGVDATLGQALVAAEVAVDRSVLIEAQKKAVESVVDAGSKSARREAILNLSEQNIGHAANTLRTTDPESLTSKDVDNLVDTVESGYRLARDTVRTGDNRLKPSRVSKLANLAKAASRIYEGLKTGNRDALRDAAARLLGEAGNDVPNAEALNAFRAIQEENKKNLEAIAEAQESIADAITSGKDEDVAEAVRKSNRVGELISSKSYGEKIMSKVFETVVGRVPWLKTLPYFAGKFGDSLPENWDRIDDDVLSSSNEPGNKIKVLYGQIRTETWTQEDGKPGRTVMWHTQPTIFVSRNRVKIGVRANWYGDGSPPSRFTLGFCARSARFGQTIRSVTVAYANGDEETITDGGGYGFGFDTKGRIVSGLKTSQECAGRKWSHIWHVSGY